MKATNVIAITGTLLFAGIAARKFASESEEAPLETVPFVNLDRYLGTWYEISRFDHFFERNCVAATATYSSRNNGNIEVLNECRLNNFDGKVKSVKGTAKVVDKKTRAKLEVTFFWPFRGKYWIIDLGRDYEYAVVGHPNRKYLWILSRTPEMDESTLAGIRSRIQKKGFDLSKLIMTPQTT